MGSGRSYQQNKESITIQVEHEEHRFNSNPDGLNPTHELIQQHDRAVIYLGCRHSYEIGQGNNNAVNNSNHIMNNNNFRQNDV